MALLSLYIFVFSFFLDCRVVLGQVLQNRTVDDNDPAIRYIGQWNPSAVSSLDMGGRHMLSQDPTAQAIFEFTGKSLVNLS